MMMKTNPISTVLFLVLLGGTGSFALLVPIQQQKAAALTTAANKLNKASRSSSPSSDSMVTTNKKKQGTTIKRQRQRQRRTKWGIDKDYENEYWFDERIHTLGNNGLGGAIHAAIAPFSTKLIDIAAYDGINVREQLAQRLSETLGNKHKEVPRRVVDLCCGVGCSTRALHEAFPNASIWGIDTSAEMLAMANFITRHVEHLKPMFGMAASKVSESYKDVQEKGRNIGGMMLNKKNPQQQRKSTTTTTTTLKCPDSIQYARNNAEHTELPSKSFDLVTIMYAFHEAPRKGRDRILKEARRLLSPGGTLAVVDISADYQPSASMLRGEPYVQEYQQNIHKQLSHVRGFEGARYETVIPHHLGMWTLKKRSSSTVMAY